MEDVEELKCHFTFDNSLDNPFNPDPAEYVTWGDQTWEEMAVAFFDVAVPLQHDAEDSESPSTDEEEIAPERVDAVVRSFLESFDTNGDGHVQREETPHSMRAFGFWQLDRDRDERLSPDEIRTLARQRLAR